MTTLRRKLVEFSTIELIFMNIMVKLLNEQISVDFGKYNSHSLKKSKAIGNHYRELNPAHFDPTQTSYQQAIVIRIIALLSLRNL